jgi:hypothetical protein
LQDGTRITVESTHPRGRIRVVKERPTPETIQTGGPSPPLANHVSRDPETVLDDEGGMIYDS